MKNDNMVICELCGKSFCTKGIGSHKWRVHGFGRGFNPGLCYQTGKKAIWNSGLTRETNEIVERISKKLERKLEQYEIDINDDGKLLQRYRNKCVNAKKRRFNMRIII